MSILADYNEMFPGTLPDTWQLSDDQIDNLDKYCKMAIERGEPLTANDFDVKSFMEPDSDTGLVI